MAAIKTSEVKVGDVLYDVHREKAGNTTIGIEGCWEAVVSAVAEDGSWAEARWNGNAARRHRETFPKGWKRQPKEWLRQSILGGRSCALCQGKELDGHKDYCEHPRAVAARKRAEKEAAAEAKRRAREVGQ